MGSSPAAAVPRQHTESHSLVSFSSQKASMGQLHNTRQKMCSAELTAPRPGPLAGVECGVTVNYTDNTRQRAEWTASAAVGSLVSMKSGLLGVHVPSGRC